FRPAHRWVVQQVVAMLAFGILTPLVVIIVAAHYGAEPDGPPWWFVVTCATITGFAGFAAAAYFWWHKATPLIVQRSGRIAYGSRVLLEPGATRRLYIERHSDSEGTDSFTVVSENRWGSVVRIETPYLDAYDTHTSAYWFATQLGSIIGVEVVPAEPNARVP
ncbi:MAG TPA: hypothetical protein PLX97_01060, partial [Gemmatales bacterium]|nr:hypothetical protein [Gemmatales bacterium]